MPRSTAEPGQRERTVWVFNTADTFVGNPKWLFVHVNRFRPDVEAWWISASDAVVEEVRGLGFRATTFASEEGRAVQRRAGVWVVNQVKEEIPPELDGAVLLNLWHGVGVKSIERGMNEGYLRERIARKYIRNNRAYHERQLFLVTSPAMEEHFARYIGLSEERTIRAGYPQNVYPRHHPGPGERRDLRAEHGLAPSTTLALYAPTPRREANATFLARALPDVDRLVAVLREHDTALVLKMHPHLTADPAFARLRERYGDEPRLIFWDNRRDVYEYADQLDVAVVDYSSILYDLLEAGLTRVVRYAFDYDDGANPVLQPGTDYRALSCGSWAGSFDELLERLGERNEVPGDELDRLHDYFWAYSREDSLDVVVDHALGFDPVPVDLPTLHSFDVFDTVIRRRVVVPEGVFHHVQHRLDEGDHAYPGYLARHFSDVRRDVEKHLREARRKRPELVESGDLEITFAQIYERIAELYDLSDDQRDRLAGWELDAELACVEPRPEQVRQVRDLVAAGERVVLISDQYLPADVVRRLLARADPVLADLPLYLSNERHAQKSTLQLYLAVYEDLGYDFGRWVHTGDNRFADVRQARRLGIEAVPVGGANLVGFERRLGDAVPTYDAFLVAGLLREARLRKDATPATRFAYRNVSLYLVPYLDWVLDDAVRRGYRTLYFVARDGHHLQRVAQRLIEERGLDIETRFVYGSRRAWRLASQVGGVDDDTFSPFGSFAGIRNLEELAETADLSLPELLELVPSLRRHAGTPELTPHTVRDVREEVAASPEFRRHLAESARADHELTTDYLAATMDLSEPFAVVEYWGRGYTQDCLVRLLESVAGHPVRTPFYYARSIYGTEGEAVRHNFTSSPRPLIFMEAVFANLPYGTVEGYERTGGEVRPVTRSRAYDAALLEALEDELPAFAADFAALPLLDRDRVRRELFDFAVADFDDAPEQPVYVESLGHLKDAVMLGGEEQEFAPALGLRDFVDHMRGKRLHRLTTSVPISVERSAGLAGRLFRWRMEKDPPRWVPAERRTERRPQRWERDRPTPPRGRA